MPTILHAGYRQHVVSNRKREELRQRGWCVLKRFPLWLAVQLKIPHEALSEEEVGYPLWVEGLWCARPDFGEFVRQITEAAGSTDEQLAVLGEMLLDQRWKEHHAGVATLIKELRRDEGHTT